MAATLGRAQRLGALVAWLALGATAAPVRASDLLVAPNAVVAADNELASRAGVEVLQAGGNAVDAAVAVGLTLGVVNPFASGIGGGGFLVFRDAETGEVVALDFREMAPAAAHRDMYVIDGVHDPEASRYGGLAVGVPGEAAGWWEVHQRYGRLDWAAVVEPARRMAAEGFPAGTLLEDRLISAEERMQAFPDIRTHFQTDGRWYEAGDTVVRPGLGRVLETFAAEGRQGFYSGWVADDIVASVSAAGGIITHDDLLAYEPRWLEPVSSTYRGHEVYGMPAPSSGGLVVAQVLATLDAFELGRGAYDDAITAHIVMQAFAHAFADRAAHLGDPDFWPIPVERFLGAARTEEILAAYRPTHTLEVEDYGPLIAAEADGGTSHFSIVDDEGNAVACTVTVNTSFGPLVIGAESDIVFNNEMDDFAAQPGVPNAFGLVGGEANAVEAGKRPLSSMSPTIVVRDGELVGVLGGSGGPMIITETVLGILQMIDFGRDAAEAVAAPRYHHQWLPFVAILEDTSGASWSELLPEFGYAVVQNSFGSALQIVWRHPEGWQAASDPRKHGAPAGY